MDPCLVNEEGLIKHQPLVISICYLIFTNFIILIIIDTKWMYSADADGRGRTRTFYFYLTKQIFFFFFFFLACIYLRAQLERDPESDRLGHPPPPPISKLYEHYAQIPGWLSTRTGNLKFVKIIGVSKGIVHTYMCIANLNIRKWRFRFLV